MEFINIIITKDEYDMDVYECTIVYYDYSFRHQFPAAQFDNNGTLDLAKAETHINTFIDKAYANFLKRQKPTLEDLQSKIEELQSKIV